jgi:hypothetical protein
VRRTGNREGRLFFSILYAGGLAAAVSLPRRAREGNGPQVRGVRRCGKGWAPVLGWMLGPCGSRAGRKARSSLAHSNSLVSGSAQLGSLVNL